MAIFYQMIKGLTNNTNTKDNQEQKLLYSYTTWPTEKDQHPTFYTSYNNLHTFADLSNPQKATNCGEIFIGGLNNNLKGSIILSEDSKIKIDDNTYFTRPKDENYIRLKGEWKFADKNDNAVTTIGDGAITTSSFTSENSFIVKYTDENNTTKLAMELKDSNIHISNNLTVDGHVDATYFNATSDRRAKTDISLFTSSALDVIKSIQVKNFKFKTSLDQPTFGIIAQELQEKAPGLNLVNNLDADGKTSFMSIKEDRLIYLLWKAIQEQQAQIEALQKEVASLKEE